jgi:hypothetical protein
MNAQEQKSQERWSRVERKLRDLLTRATDSKELGDRAAGTSEETAGLFSSGTTTSIPPNQETE